MPFPSTPLPVIVPLIVGAQPATQSAAPASQPSTQPAPPISATLVNSSDPDRTHWVDRGEAAKAKTLVALALILSLVLITAFGYILIRRVIRQWRMQSSLRERLERPITKTDDLWKISAERMATPDPDEADPDEPEDQDSHGRH